MGKFEGKWDLAFDSRRRSGPPSSFDTGPPLHPARRAPADFILTLVYRMIVPADFTL